MSIDVGPGDVLYLPPFYWHHVETLSPSISLSTLSHQNVMYSHMDKVLWQPCLACYLWH